MAATKMKSVLRVFFTLLAVFIITLNFLFTPAVGVFMDAGFSLVAIIISICGACLLGLGAFLIFLTLKAQPHTSLRRFLILTGASAAGIPVFAVLHNLTIPAIMFLFGEDYWQRSGIGDEPIFFTLAVLVSPLGFFTGAIGTIWIFFNDRAKARAGSQQ